MTDTGPTRVAIACQGGGSHTAFTAGVLKRLLGAQAEAQLRAGSAPCASAADQAGAGGSNWNTS